MAVTIGTLNIGKNGTNVKNPIARIFHSALIPWFSDFAFSIKAKRCMSMMLLVTSRLALMFDRVRSSQVHCQTALIV